MDVENPDEEIIYEQWRRVRLRLEAVLGKSSGLAAPLAAYAVDSAHRITLDDVRAIRDEYGAASEPEAEELIILLDVDND